MRDLNAYKREWRKRNPDKVHAEYVRRLAKHGERHREINRASVKRYVSNNREKVNARVRAWYKRTRANPKVVMTPEQRQEAYRAARQRYYYKDHEAAKAKQRSYARVWRAANKTTAALRDKIKRARRKGAAGTCTPEQWMARVAYYGNCCKYCKKSLTLVTLTVDHMIPICRGGANWPSNLAPCCRGCNSSKRQKTSVEYIAWRVLRGLS